MHVNQRMIRTSLKDGVSVLRGTVFRGFGKTKTGLQRESLTAKEDKVAKGEREARILDYEL